MKIVYLWKNGQPVIVTANEEGEFEYPSEKWTETKPDDGMYIPIYFDGQKWIGQSKEDFEKTLPPEPIDEKDVIIADLTSQMAQLHQSVEENKTVVSELMTRLALMQGGKTNG